MLSTTPHYPPLPQHPHTLPALPRTLPALPRTLPALPHTLPSLPLPPQTLCRAALAGCRLVCRYNSLGWYTQGTLRVHTGYTQGTHRAHAGHTQGTRRVHAGYMQGTRRVHAAVVWAVAKGVAYKSTQVRPRSARTVLVYVERGWRPSHAPPICLRILLLFSKS